jgi:hypothetical protein
MATLLNPFLRADDANGTPVSGGQLAVFDAGTTTPVTTYSDRALTTAQAQPLIANSAGEFAQSFVASGIYKIRVSDADGVTLYENDNVRIADRPDDPIFLDDIQAVLDDTNTYATGVYILALEELERFEALASGATDFTDVNAGGQKLRRSAPPMSLVNGKYDLSNLGIDLTGATDATSAIQTFLTSIPDFQGAITCPAGTVQLSGTLAIPKHASFECEGTVFDASGSTAAFDRAVILKAGAVPTQIADLSATPVKGDALLSFANAHGLSVGDTVLVYNPTDSSYSTWRADYQEGEFFKVAEVPSSTQIVTDTPVMADSHSHTASNVYKCDMATGAFGGFTAIAPGPGPNGIINGWRMEWCEGVALRNTASDNSDNASAVMKNCFRCSGSKMREHQWSAVNLDFGTHYGFVIVSSQQLDLSGEFVGWRHGIATGASNDFSIPNRVIETHDFVAKNKLTGLAAADWHGNTEFSSYRNGVLHGGGLYLAGDFNTIEDIKITGGDDTIALIGREMIGMTHKVKNIQCFTRYSDTARGSALNIGGNETSAFSANTRRGGHLSIDGMDIIAPNQEQFLFTVLNRGFAGDPWSIAINDVQVNGEARTTSFALVRVNTVSGDAPHSIQCTKFREPRLSVLWPLLLGSLDADVPVRMDSCSQVESFDLTTDTILVERIVDLPIRYPKVPVPATTFIGGNFSGATLMVNYVFSISATQIRPRIITADASNFSAAATRQVGWSVSLNEF